MTTPQEHALSTAAIKYMAEHDIPPTPENYSIWYHYALGANETLKEEVNKIIAQKLRFTTKVCAFLYQKFFSADPGQRMIDDSAHTAQKMLKDVFDVINNFSGETKNYNQELGVYIENISKQENADVKEVIKSLVTATLELKQRGETMNQKLEESKSEIDNLRAHLQQATSEAQKDGLTGLYNRRTFERKLEEQLEQARAEKTDLCIIMMDVDHFKKFNDTYGHLLGDEVLKIVARTLTETLKGRDVVARFGGEEFIVLLPATPLDGAMRVADAIRTTIAGKELKRKDTGQNFGQITVSLGVARYRHGVDDIPKLVKRADEALYESKRSGRNRATREA